MAATIVNYVISSYLADYLEINPEKTKTSLLSGTIELSGVKFKKSLFSTLNVPYLELEDGYIGKINVAVSLPRFYLYPIEVYIDQIYIKVRPKNVNKISEDEIIETYEIYKQKKIKEFEESMNVKFSALFDDGKNSSDNKGESTYLQCIINNLHINIGKIVFIFDDCISDPKHPFTFGATLNKLFIESTSEDFSDKRVDDSSSPFKYKKLSIESLNLFLDKIKYENIEKDKDTGDVSAKHPIKKDKINSLTDKDKEYLKDSLDFYLYCESEITDYIKDENYHNYLLRDLNIVIKLTINEKYEENKQPQINVFMETSTILTQITNKQLKSITDCTNYISLKIFINKLQLIIIIKKKNQLIMILLKNI